MSRRHSSKQDSLELLLDTICNTFGGVLFIAILVVLLLQQTGATPVANTPDEVPVSLEEFQATTARFESVTEELARLRLNRDALDSVAQALAPADLRELFAITTELTARQEALQDEVNQQLVANTQAVIDVEALKADTATIETRRVDSKTRLAALEAQLAAERKSRVHETKMPVLHDQLHKSEVGLILQYGRLYVWHKYDGLERVGLNTDDLVVIGEKGGWLVVQPNPTAGVPLEESSASKEAIRRVLRRFDPKQYTVCAIVRPDTYAHFHHLRDAAIELGFEYRLMPTGENDPISDRGGSGGQVQ